MTPEEAGQLILERGVWRQCIGCSGSGWVDNAGKEECQRCYGKGSFLRRDVAEAYKALDIPVPIRKKTPYEFAKIWEHYSKQIMPTPIRNADWYQVREGSFAPYWCISIDGAIRKIDSK